MKEMRSLTLIAIVIFAGMLLWRSHAHKAEQVAVERNEARAQDILKPYRTGSRNNVSDLEYAYTGKWAKNRIQEPNNTFAFQQPQNPRNNVVIAKPKKEDKKKKKVAKKQATKYRYYTGPRYQNTFAKNNDQTPSYPQPAGAFPNQNVPSPVGGAAAQPDKKLSAKEYLEKILKTKSINQLVKDYKDHDTDAKTFYSVLDLLLAPTQTNPAIRVLAYQAMGEVQPSLQSFELISEHAPQESAESQQAAQNDLRSYANISQMPIMNNALRVNNNAVRIGAAQVIQAVATQVIQGQSTGGHGGMVYTTQMIHQYFGPILTTLTQLLQTNLDSQVSSAFTTTRNTVAQFLG